MAGEPLKLDSLAGHDAQVGDLVMYHDTHYPDTKHGPYRVLEHQSLFYVTDKVHCGKYHLWHTYKGWSILYRANLSLEDLI